MIEAATPFKIGCSRLEFTFISSPVTQCAPHGCQSSCDPLIIFEKIQADYFEMEFEKALSQFIGTLKQKSVIEIKL